MPPRRTSRSSNELTLCESPVTSLSPRIFGDNLAGTVDVRRMLPHNARSPLSIRMVFKNLIMIWGKYIEYIIIQPIENATRSKAQHSLPPVLAATTTAALAMPLKMISAAHI